MGERRERGEPSAAGAEPDGESREPEPVEDEGLFELVWLGAASAAMALGWALDAWAALLGR